MRRFAALLTILSLAPLAAGADVSIKDAAFKTYLRYTNAMIRIDKIESVRHIDGNPILGDFDPGDDTGYLIVSLSVQNPGTAEIFMPNFGTVLFLEDQSKIAGDFRGPYVGAKTVEAPGRIAQKESLAPRAVRRNGVDRDADNQDRARSER